MKDESGYAFPGKIVFEVPKSSYREGEVMTFGGLTKREWYAGMALQGMMANETQFDGSHGDLAKEAFKYSDAMLAESKKE